jgi:intein/homing endonuclease
MNNNDLTIWQRLTKTFGPNSLLNQDYPTYKFDKEELLRTKNKGEYEREKLQAQQSYYLASQWAKVENNLYTQAIYYEPSRLSAQYDFESMEYSIFGDTKIATPNGFITIKELADKGRDYEFITYAYDHNTKKVVPAIARNAHYTRDEMTYKITFDDGSHIIATYGHRFLKRDGVFEVVENLKPGDSMMPFYRKSFYDNQNYHWVYTCNSNEGHHGWIAEHNLIAEWHYNTKLNKNEEVHHIDFNGKNNLPENLQIMDRTEHRAYHARLNNERLWSNPEYRKKMSEVARRKGKLSWNGRRQGKNNPSYIKISFDKIVETAKEKRSMEETSKTLGISIKKLQNELRFNGFKNWDDFLSVYKIKKYYKISEDYHLINFKLIPWDLLIEVAKKEKTMDNVCKRLNITMGKLRSTIRQGGYKNWGTFMEAYGMKKSKAGRRKVTEEEVVVNHKIVSIEPYGVVPVYDLTVPGYKNFATDTIFSHNTPEISAALDIYAEESTTADEDGFILQIYSESKRIKGILADLFNNVLDINTNLPMWTRNCCKFGDNFVYLKLDPEKGIVGCQQLPTIEIERMESGTLQRTTSDPQQLEDKKPLTFEWKNKQMTFQSWEVAHFRLLGDDRKLPYGTCLKYDTKIDTEYGFKRIKDINIGDNVYSFDLKTEKRVLSKVLDVVNSGVKVCYEIKTKNSFIEASEEHKILIFDGKEYVYKNVLDLKVGDNLILDNFSWDVSKKSYELDSILSINQVGEYETYDIYVENENHNFYANGLVVHNSMLEKARRIWKQLLLSEDAMLIYRVSRAPERRVFKVFVGNMNDEDIEPYVNRVADKFKRTQIVDSKTGNVDLRFNQMAVDQDYFIPVRDPATPSPIETLPGATNLSEIADIEYIQKKLVTALRVPKAFLGFEEVVGGGKDLALQDIRFARTINRIQKSMLQELNKIAIVHLFVLGFEDELNNFTLNLTNPSTQADLLKIDIWKEKVALYRELVADPGNGISAASATWSKKHVFGWSDDEVKLDLQQQRIERAVGEELKGTPTVIVKTGIFDNVDKLYGNATGQTQTQATQDTGTDFGGAFGGDLGGDLGAIAPPAGGEVPPPPPESGEALPTGEITPESTEKDMNILLENSITEGKKVINLGNGQKSLKEISKQLDKLLNT